MAALIILSVKGTSYAQPLVLLGFGKPSYQLKEEKNLPHRHVVHLDEKRNIMDIRMRGLFEYSYIKNIDSILKVFMQDIEFYKDSLDGIGSGNMRIAATYLPDDYAPRFRFKTYESDGQYFVKKDGETSFLKTKQDTIHISIVFEVPDSADRKIFRWRRYAHTHIYFYLNKYTDIETYVKEGNLQQYIDTMKQAALRETKGKRQIFTTLIYNPFLRNENVKLFVFKHRHLVDNSLNQLYPGNKYFTKVSFNGNMGVGIVRGQLAPMADMGFEYRSYWTQGKKECSIFGIFASPYFLFEKSTEGTYHTYNNWFVNAEFGTAGVKGDIELLNLQRFTIGGGYLLNPDGIHFQNTTIKVFSNITLNKGITVSPEVIATNNFKNIFPGITVKVF